jgi:hypothetical protein
MRATFSRSPRLPFDLECAPYVSSIEARRPVRRSPVLCAALYPGRGCGLFGLLPVAGCEWQHIART